MTRVLVVGAGLAGSEAAWFLAERGVDVCLAEVKTLKLNPAQKTTHFAELVCTNSLKSFDPNSAHGLLKTEMRALGSLVLSVADATAVPAGDALAVDRELFSAEMTRRLHAHPRVRVIATEVADPLALMRELECGQVIVATGPLTTSPLEQWLVENLGAEDIYFYDAIAPVVDADTLDYSKLYYKDRHRQPDERADYLNAPMTKEQYDAFVGELARAEKVPPKDFEDWKFFESCLPVDLMAERGPETARFSCMKPIGLELPDGSEPWAVVQLRKENLAGAAFNLVGFQTRLTYKEQVRVFRMIPGLEDASFIHLGSCHRNSFLNSRRLLDQAMVSRLHPVLSFAGQITGVEGYTESAAMGLYVAAQLWRRMQGQENLAWPKETAIGALVNYVMTVEKPTPSNINFGLLPTVELTKEQRKQGPRKKVRKILAATRAREVFEAFRVQL
jgi:methylenetetrahydrofolate--tRNA-(uracil-5-)-methyltransferase